MIIRIHARSICLFPHFKDFSCEFPIIHDEIILTEYKNNVQGMEIV